MLLPTLMLLGTHSRGPLSPMRCGAEAHGTIFSCYGPTMCPWLGIYPTEGRAELVGVGCCCSSCTEGRRQAARSTHSMQTLGRERVPCWKEKKKKRKGSVHGKRSKNRAEEDKGSRSRKENYKPTHDIGSR